MLCLIIFFDWFVVERTAGFLMDASSNPALAANVNYIFFLSNTNPPSSHFLNVHRITPKTKIASVGLSINTNSLGGLTTQLHCISTISFHFVFVSKNLLFADLTKITQCQSNNFCIRICAPSFLDVSYSNLNF